MIHFGLDFFFRVQNMGILLISRGKNHWIFNATEGSPTFPHTAPATLALPAASLALPTAEVGWEGEAIHMVHLLTWEIGIFEPLK